MIQFWLTSETDGKISRTLYRETSGPRKAVLGLLLETMDKNSSFLYWNCPVVGKPFL